MLRQPLAAGLSDVGPAGYRLRQARADEGPVLSGLAFEAKAALGYPPALMEHWRDVLRIDPSLGPTWVAELDGEPVAVAAWSIDGDRAQLNDLWVRPNRQHAGLGRLLLAQAVDHARRNGCTRLAIDAEPHAAGFYLRWARRCGSEPAPIDGQPDRVRPQFELDLSAPPGA